MEEKEKTSRMLEESKALLAQQREVMELLKVIGDRIKSLNGELSAHEEELVAYRRALDIATGTGGCQVEGSPEIILALAKMQLWPDRFKGGRQVEPIGLNKAGDIAVKFGNQDED